MASKWILRFLLLFPLLACATTGTPYTSYDRHEWQHWVDVDTDCQYTRDEILIRESHSQVQFKTNKGCKVRGGTWYGHYSNQRMNTSTEIHIDHVLPLKLAHEYGGWTWDREQKKKFANDMENLVVSSSSVNRRKSAKGPAKWLPPNPNSHCEYARHWKHIIRKYGLRPHQEDLRVLEQILEGC